MVNDGKDIRLDTPQAVKEALASGKDLYNPQTGDARNAGNDPITVKGEATAMKAASAEMADGAGKHDIGQDAR